MWFWKTKQKDKQAQLCEYAELGNLCRNYESLSRTSLAIFVAFSTAITTFVLGKDTTREARITLEVIGLGFSGLTLYMLTRVRSLYVTRAKHIEKELGFKVYRRWNAERGPLTNKQVMQLMVLLFIAYFFAKLTIDVWCWLNSH